MNLRNAEQTQAVWRPWPRVLDELPHLEGSTILDLGCGDGHLTSELVARGAYGIGVDLNEDALREARARRLPNADFLSFDLRAPFEPGVEADGIVCAFAAAYFPELEARLIDWKRHLRPGGWIALVEIDDLFGHEPLGSHARKPLDAYARAALAAGRYDFCMGRRLTGHLERAGFCVSKSLELPDLELAFDGPARPEVVDAWRARLGRMRLLKDFCGSDFALVHDEFLGCLVRADHRSTAKVEFRLGVQE